MYAVDRNIAIKDILEDKRTYKFSRVPVYEETIDNIVGIVLTKKLFKQAIKDKNASIESIMKPVFTLNENIPVGKALNKFIQKKKNICLSY